MFVCIVSGRMKLESTAVLVSISRSCRRSHRCALFNGSILICVYFTALCTDGTVWIWSTVSGTLERIFCQDIVRHNRSHAIIIIVLVIDVCSRFGKQSDRNRETSSKSSRGGRTYCSRRTSGCVCDACSSDCIDA